MAMAISVPRYTLADLERFPDDGNRYEPLDGMLIVTAAPTNAHQIVVNRLQFRLTQTVMISRVAQVVGPGPLPCLRTRSSNRTFSCIRRAIRSIRSGRTSTSTGLRCKC